MLSEREIVAGFHRYEGVLRNFIRNRISSRLQRAFDAEDILQQTYVDAWANFGDFRGGSMLAWLKTVANRNLIDRLRMEEAKKRGGGRMVNRIGNGVATSSSGIPVAGAERSPSSNVAKSESAELVATYLESLPVRQKIAIELRFIQSKSVKQVGLSMGISTAAAQMLIGRGLKTLRSHIREQVSS